MAPPEFETYKQLVHLDTLFSGFNLSQVHVIHTLKENLHID